MTSRFAAGVCAGLVSMVLLAQTTSTGDVGSGAPTDNLRRSFVAAWFRNLFYTQVASPPLADVKKFGTAGYVQEFQDANKTSGVKLALVAPNSANQPGDGSDIYQILHPMYNYYSSVGLNTAGNPTTDTIPCPSNTPSPCQYQNFDKKYVLFAYTVTAQNYALRDPFYTKWVALGGIQKFGAVATAETAVTTTTGSVGTLQTYTNGAIVNITSGLLTGRLVAVTRPIYSLYVQNNGASGFLGFPTGDETQLPNGTRRQVFEGGTVDYGSDGVPQIRLPISTIAFQTVLTTVKLNLGDTYNVQAIAYGADGRTLTDRTINYLTSNSRVVTVQASANGAVIRAVGGGTANVTATAEGKTSSAITFLVTAPCCAIGEGAPTESMQILFQDAVARSKLSVQLPAANPVRRAGAGYVQELQSSDAKNPARYLLAVSDKAAIAYVVTGSVLTAYEALGGPAQSFGYPTADAVIDASRTPRQTFVNGALAGNPVRPVTAPFLLKWATSGYETGPAGFPASDPETLLSFAGTDARSQVFQKGIYYVATSGAQAGKVYLVAGLPLAKYISLGAGKGQLGLPVTDEYGLSGKRRQDFEGGTLEYAPGDTETQLLAKPRNPAVTVTPAVVPAGTRARISVGGFPDAASLRVSVTGQTDFVVSTQTGSFAWDVFVPQNAATSTVTVRAVNTAAAMQSAQTTYAIRALADVKAQIVKLSGDTQAALPGSMLPVPLRVSVRDDAGSPLANVPVRFTASPGGSIVAASANTDSAGEAIATVRLPASEGIALFNVEAVRQVATFSARSAQGGINAFPKLMQTDAKTGSLAASAASILRLYQNRGLMAQGNGPADPALLTQFLKTACELDASGTQVCDGFLETSGSTEPVLNLWRLDNFSPPVSVSIEDAKVESIRDLVAADNPVLVTLALTSENIPAGVHHVVAIGVAADGSILIHDPSPVYKRSNLSEYLAGFATQEGRVGATIATALRLTAESPTASGFLVNSSTSTMAIRSPAGDCGRILVWPASATAKLAQRYCDGLQANYQLDITSDQEFDAIVTDLGSLATQYKLRGGGGTASFRATRPGAQLLITAQDVSFTTRGVVNAATFTSDVAPGGLVAIFGTGLARDGATTGVQVDDKSAAVVLSSPFQLNAQLPGDIQPGTHNIRVISPYGTQEQPIEVQANAPAIFRIDPSLGGENRGAILNAGNTLNLPSNPARRGTTVSIYGTGFGAVAQRNGLSVTTAPVTAVLGGIESPVAYSGLAPGFVGLYQINLAIPQTAAPGLSVSLSFRQAGVESSPVQVAIQ